jgi:hypothetical protein
MVICTYHQTRFFGFNNTQCYMSRSIRPTSGINVPDIKHKWHILKTCCSVRDLVNFTIIIIIIIIIVVVANSNILELNLKNFQRDDALYSTLLFPVSRSTCFGPNPRPSSGAQFKQYSQHLGWQTDSSTTTAGHTPFVNPDAVNTV